MFGEGLALSRPSIPIQFKMGHALNCTQQPAHIIINPENPTPSAICSFLCGQFSGCGRAGFRGRRVSYHSVPASLISLSACQTGAISAGPPLSLRTQAESGAHSCLHQVCFRGETPTTRNSGLTRALEGRRHIIPPPVFANISKTPNLVYLRRNQEYTLCATFDFPGQNFRSPGQVKVVLWSQF